jgi:NAD(P)H dehydrogenase (quinone)
MCFPSKNQKALYSDEPAKQQPPSSDIKAPAAPIATSSTTPNVTSMAPNVAIILYTMYGHVAKCSLSPHPPSSIPLLIDRLSPVAEAEKKGIEAAGGSATIYQ